MTHKDAWLVADKLTGAQHTLLANLAGGASLILQGRHWTVDGGYLKWTRRVQTSTVDALVALGLIAYSHAGYVAVATANGCMVGRVIP